MENASMDEVYKRLAETDKPLLDEREPETSPLEGKEPLFVERLRHRMEAQ